MPPSLPSAVVFDNDGLLLDTESVWTRAEEDLFELRGAEFTPADKLELVGTSAEIAGGILERRLGEPGRAAELIEELNELVVAELEHGVEAMLGARELLERLRDQGLPLGLVSNSPLRFVRRSIELAGFEDFFDVVLSAHEVAAPKPAPDPYLEACRRLGVEPGPGVVALEDSPTGVAAARAAGCAPRRGPPLGGVVARRSGRAAPLCLAAEDAPPAQNSLGRLQALLHRRLLVVPKGCQVGLLAGVLDSLQFRQQRFDADSQLQGGLAVPTGVHVGAGA
jgi:HAD superfamily hydrolase (TIGR01509 family)